MPFASGVRGDARDGVGGDVEGLDRLALRREREAEAAVVAETVEHPAVRVTRGRLAVLALIEEQAGLLPAPRIDGVGDAGFVDADRLRHDAVQHLDLLLEAFERADFRIVAREDAFRAGHLGEQPDQRRRQAIHPLRQGLHHEIVAVAIDDQRRQQVGLAVHEAEGGGVDLQRVAEANRGVEPRAPERLVDRHLIRRHCARDHADRDLRLIAEERVAEDAIARPAHFDDRAGIGVDDVGDVGSIDPRMSAADAIFAARFENRCRHL